MGVDDSEEASCSSPSPMKSRADGHVTLGHAAWSPGSHTAPAFESPLPFLSQRKPLTQPVLIHPREPAFCPCPHGLAQPSSGHWSGPPSPPNLRDTAHERQLPSPPDGQQGAVTFSIDSWPNSRITGSPLLFDFFLNSSQMGTKAGVTSLGQGP